MRSRGMRERGGHKRRLFGFGAAFLLASRLLAASGASDCPPADPPDAAEESAQAAAQAVSPPSSAGHVVGSALWNELKRYGSDTAALVVAPFHWDSRDGWRAGAAAVAIGGSFAADKAVYDAFARNRSDFTNDVSGGTSWFGSPGALCLSVGLIGAGLVFESPNVRDMGRDSLEAIAITGIFTNVVIKTTAGRYRPKESDGETKFDPFSGHTSFTSGHATAAFAFASVVAMRSPGWIVPTVVYGLASVVAFDRINDREHFLSDVVTGALFATATGRFLVHRHRDEKVVETVEPPEPHASFQVVPIREGLALRASW